MSHAFARIEDATWDLPAVSTALLPMADAAAALAAPPDAQARHGAIYDAELNIVDAGWARELKRRPLTGVPATAEAEMHGAACASFAGVPAGPVADTESPIAQAEVGDRLGAERTYEAAYFALDEATFRF